MDWSEILQRYGSMVWRTVARLLIEEAEAEDCFQRTFVAALELSRTEPVRNWEATLRHLATARALDRLRQKLRRDEGELPEAGGVDPVPSSPLQEACAAELRGDLRRLLGRADLRQAQVFCLVCIEGLEHREVARQLDLSVSHVGVLLHRVRHQLREGLSSHLSAPPAQRTSEGSR